MIPILSIIVPVYNTENYLNKCIDSILKQKFNNFELILIDDCSTDKSKEICCNYSLNDKRIKFIRNEKNQGQSLSRNKGLEVAQGKYIGFIDSDDSIDENMYLELINQIEKGYDLVVCGRVVEDNDKRTYVKNEEKEYNFENDKNVKWNYLCQEFIYPCTVSTCNKIYRKDLIHKINLRFRDLKLIGTEDTLFNYQYLFYCNKIKTLDKEYYIGYSREGSTMKSYNPGYLKRYGNLLEELYLYKYEYIPEKVRVIIGLYFLQFYIEQIKKYSLKEDYKLNLQKELKSLKNNIYLKKLFKEILINRSGYTKELKKKGYSWKGLLYIKLYLLIYYKKINENFF